MDVSLGQNFGFVTIHKTDDKELKNIDSMQLNLSVLGMSGVQGMLEAFKVTRVSQNTSLGHKFTRTQTTKMIFKKTKTS